jgi:hypothetical protein
MKEDVLAKKASKSKGHTKKARKARRKTASSVRREGLSIHEEDHIDGCDVEFDESEATPDAALPAARGGVEEVRGRRRA